MSTLAQHGRAEPLRRSLTAQERRCFAENTVLVYIGGKRGHGHIVRLKIDHQSFMIGSTIWGDLGGTSKERAQWYRRQLAIALARFKYGDPGGRKSAT